MTRFGFEEVFLSPAPGRDSIDAVDEPETAENVDVADAANAAW